MTEQIRQIRRPIGCLSLPSPWSLGALAIAIMVLMPILAVIWFALHPTDNIWPHLIATT